MPSSRAVIRRLVTRLVEVVFVDSRTDTDILFRQDSKFHYLFGVKEPDFFAAIETDTKKAILFIPQ